MTGAFAPLWLNQAAQVVDIVSLVVLLGICISCYLHKK